MADSAGPEIMLVVLFTMSLCVFACWIVGRQDKQQAAAGGLNAPLLQGRNRHRLEVASRDAHAGYYKCRLCGFENFKRLLFCSLCGTSLRLTAPLEIPKPGSHVPQRHRRARSRRDWTRKLDVEGKLFWYQAENWETKRRYQGYTLRFVLDDAQLGTTNALHEVHGEPEPEDQASTGCESKAPPLVVIEVFPPDTPPVVDAVESNTISTTPEVPTPSPPDAPETETHADDTGEPDSSATIQPPETHSVALSEKGAVARDLVAQISRLTLVLIDSESSDPPQLPLEPDAASIDWHTTLEMAQKVFPTKYSHFVTTTANLLVHVTKQYIKLSIPPDNLLADSLTALSMIPTSYIHSVMRIEFAGGRGVDAGALQREWHVLLNRELANPLNGVFKCVNAAEQTFYLNPNSAIDVGKDDDHLLCYFAAGRLVGRSLLEGQALSFHLALPLLKIILGVPLSFPDLQYFDPEAYKNLVWIMHNDGAGDLGLTFSITEQRGSEMVEVDLIEDGRHIDVTDDNKELYLERKFRYLLFESVSSQLYCFLKGIYEIIPQELLMVFDPEEFDYVLCGSDDIDVDEWQRSTIVSINLQRHGNTLKWFWEIVREMPNEYRRRLLLFATGSSRIPLGGFSALTSVDGRLCPFTLVGVKLTESTGYIVSHACFNRLDIPLYKSRYSLETMLRTILETEQHGFTTD